MKKDFSDFRAGIITDVLATDIPDNAFTDGINIRFNSGGVEKIKGDANALNIGPGLVAYYALSHRSAGSTLWSFFGQNNITISNGTNDVVATRLSGPYSTNIDQGWSGGNLKGISIVTNGVDPPQKWIPEPSLTTLYDDLLYDYSSSTSWADAGILATLMRPHGDYMIAMDTSEGGYRNRRRVWWSHPPIDSQTEPPTWDYSNPAFDAGFFDLDDTDSPIIDGLTLGNQFVVYKNDSVYTMAFTPTNDIFTKKKVFSTFGAAARHCIAPLYNQHLVLTPDDIVLHDLTQVQSILTNRLSRWLSSALNQDYLHRSFMAINYPKKEIWVGIPTTDHEWPNLALIWSWLDNTITLRELNPETVYMTNGEITGVVAETFANVTGTFDDDSGPFDSDAIQQNSNRLCALTTDSKIYAVDVGETFKRTSGMTSYIEKSGMHFGNHDSFKFLRALYPRMEGAIGSQIEVLIGTQSYVNAPVKYTKYTYKIGTHKLDCRVTGRYITIRFQSRDVNYPWRLQGFEVEYELVGINPKHAGIS